MYRGVLKLTGMALVALFLTGLFVTVVLRWREQANRMRCQDNLRQVGWFAMWDYADPKRTLPAGPRAPDRPRQLDPKAQLEPNRLFPPGTLPNPALSPDHRLSWHVILLPHLGRDELNSKFDRTLAWDDAGNRAAICTLVPLFACPTQYHAAAPDTAPVTPYIGLAGLGPDAPTLARTDPRAGFLRYDDPTTTGSMTRGFSRTISILESASALGPWAAGGASTVRGLDPANSPHIGPGRPFGGHPDGANAAFADGSVRFQAATISPHVLAMMATLSGNADDLE